jgi:hypothetical protein
MDIHEFLSEVKFGEDEQNHLSITYSSLALCGGGGHKDEKLFGSRFELYAYLFVTTKLTPWSGSRLQKIIGMRLVRKYLAFYGTQRFITVFIRAHTYKNET